MGRVDRMMQLFKAIPKSEQDDAATDLVMTVLLNISRPARAEIFGAIDENFCVYCGEDEPDDDHACEAMAEAEENDEDEDEDEDEEGEESDDKKPGERARRSS